MENSERDGNIRAADLPLEKPLCRSESISLEETWKNCFHIGNGVRQGRILSLCLFNLYAEYIMRNAGLDETQAGIKIVERHTLTLWLIHVNVWQKPPQYCKVIRVQLKLMN